MTLETVVNTDLYIYMYIAFYYIMSHHLKILFQVELKIRGLKHFDKLHYIQLTNDYFILFLLDRDDSRDRRRRDSREDSRDRRRRSRDRDDEDDGPVDVRSRKHRVFGKGEGWVSRAITSYC